MKTMITNALPCLASNKMDGWGIKLVIWWLRDSDHTNCDPNNYRIRVVERQNKCCMMQILGWPSHCLDALHLRPHADQSRSKTNWTSSLCLGFKFFLSVAAHSGGNRGFYLRYHQTKPQRGKRCDRILYFLKLISANSCPKITHLFW
jgi:hypothetical protein